MKTNFTNWVHFSNNRNLEEDIQNLGVFNEQVINLEVIPALNRESDSEFNITTLDLIWNVIRFEPNLMIIKINWTSPLEISPLTVQDEL